MSSGDVASAAVYFKYDPPKWGSPPVLEYWFNVVENGTSINRIFVGTKSVYYIGRLAGCDMEIQHVTSSRCHCVLQYSNDSKIYLYDNNSSHGTFINNIRLKAKEMTPLKVGDLIRFGMSPRTFVLQSPANPEWEMDPDRDVCWDFVNGICTWGAKCRWVHRTPVNPNYRPPAHIMSAKSTRQTARSHFLKRFEELSNSKINPLQATLEKSKESSPNVHKQLNKTETKETRPHKSDHRPSHGGRRERDYERRRRRRSRSRSRSRMERRRDHERSHDSREYDSHDREDYGYRSRRSVHR